MITYEITVDELGMPMVFLRYPNDTRRNHTGLDRANIDGWMEYHWEKEENLEIPTALKIALDEMKERGLIPHET